LVFRLFVNEISILTWLEPTALALGWAAALWEAPMLVTKRLGCSPFQTMISCFWQANSTCPDLVAHPPSCQSAASALSPAQYPAHQKRDLPLHDTHDRLKLLLTTASDQAAVFYHATMGKSSLFVMTVDPSAMHTLQDNPSLMDSKPFLSSQQVKL